MRTSGHIWTTREGVDQSCYGRGVLRASSWQRFIALLSTGFIVFACGQLSGLEDPAAGPGEQEGPDAKTVEVVPAELDLGEVACGSESVAKLLSLANKGTAPADYRVQLAEGTPFRIDGPLEGTLAPGAPATMLSVVARPASAGEVDGQLVVSVGARAQTIPIKGQGRGGSYYASTNLINFGEVRRLKGAPTLATVVVKNSGNEPLVIPEFAGVTSDFNINWEGKPTAFQVGPGEEKTLTAVFADGAETPTEVTATITPKPTGTLCGELAPLTLRGKRVSYDVTIQGVDFGQINCTPPTTTKDIIISNYASSAIGWSVALGPASVFELRSAPSGNLAPGGAKPTVGLVTLAAKSTTKPGIYNETVDVAITGVAAPSGGARQTTASLSVRGAFLTYSPTPVPGFVSNGSTADVKQIMLSNTGPDPVAIYWYWSASSGGNGPWSYASAPAVVGANSQATFSVSFWPGGSCPCSTTLYAARYYPSLLCGGPLGIPLTGTLTQ